MPSDTRNSPKKTTIPTQDVPFLRSMTSKTRNSRLLKLVIMLCFVLGFLLVLFAGDKRDSVVQQALRRENEIMERFQERAEKVRDKWLKGEKNRRAAASAGSKGLAKSRPFEEFYCLGEELGTEQIYDAPFRFHVYQDTLQAIAASPSGTEVDTTPYSLETDLFASLARHPCHAMDPKEADVFIIPTAPKEALQARDQDALKKETKYAIDAPSEREIYSTAFEGRDHYILLHSAGAAPLQTQERFHLGNLNTMSVEASLNMLGPGSTSSAMDLETWYKGSHDVVLPAPVAPLSVDYTKKEKANLVIALGIKASPTSGQLSKILSKQMEQYSARQKTKKAVWHQVSQEGPEANLLPSAVFGLVLSDAASPAQNLFRYIAAGIIPVIVYDKIMLPFEDVLDYTSFVVFTSEQQILQQPRDNLMDLLDLIPKKEVSSMLENGKKVKRHFEYHKRRVVPGDAVDMLVRRLAKVNYSIRGLKSTIERSGYSMG